MSILNKLKSIRPFRSALYPSASQRAVATVAWPEESLDLTVTDHGGYFPPALGKVFNSRYTIVRKLGWGQHSSVWLAKDEKCKRYVAMKILSVSATNVQNRVSHELELLQHIQRLGKTTHHPGYAHVMSLLDNFHSSSHHGSHLCLITDVLGSHLGAAKKLMDRNRLPIGLVKNIANQLVLALDFLHSECEIIHTDIKPNNILFTVQDSDVAATVSRECLTHTPDGSPLPPHAVISHPISTLTSTDLLDPKTWPRLCVKLIDFGTAASFQGHHANLIQPFALRAPEVLIGCGWGPSADIWNLGCLISELLIGNWLFLPRAGDNYTLEQHHLVQMTSLFTENFNLQNGRGGSHFKTYFDDNGRLRVGGRTQTIDEIFRVYKVFNTEDELLGCVSFLRLMLRLTPSDRATAKELMRHEWLKPEHV